MTRIVPREGAQIDENFIPGNVSYRSCYVFEACLTEYKLCQTIVGMSNLFVHLNADIFYEPRAFKPERWLEVKEGDGESLEHWLVAFSKGPRSCLGLKYVASVSRARAEPY